MVKKLPEEELSRFVKSLDDSQLKFLARWLGDTYDSRSNHAQVFRGVYVEEVHRLFKRPNIDAGINPSLVD